MYQRASKRITSLFIQNQIIAEEDREVYEFSFEIMLSGIVYFLIAAVVALVSRTVIESLLFFAGFQLIRKFAGGYHADTYRNCHLIFLGNHLLVVGLIRLLPETWYGAVLWGFGIISLILIWCFAPVEAENKPFTEAERKKFRRLSRLVATTILVLLAVVWLIKLPLYYPLCVIYGVVSVSVSVPAAAMKAKVILKRERETIEGKGG